MAIAPWRKEETRSREIAGKLDAKCSNQGDPLKRLPKLSEGGPISPFSRSFLKFFLRVAIFESAPAASKEVDQEFLSIRDKRGLTIFAKEFRGYWVILGGLARPRGKLGADRSEPTHPRTRFPPSNSRASRKGQNPSLTNIWERNEVPRVWERPGCRWLCTPRVVYRAAVGGS
ncbi:hypothetical protein KM043_002576 [Ampulex compressa]|nr:hypothetical protein KM043_002576 [Ampulex compressa]